jgi:hypothetical protein
MPPPESYVANYAAGTLAAVFSRRKPAVSPLTSACFVLWSFQFS